jgi:hypothetical protein
MLSIDTADLYFGASISINENRTTQNSSKFEKSLT